MGKTEMVDIADFFKDLLINKKDPEKVKKEVIEFKKGFQEIRYCFQSPNKAYEYMKFY
jgi:glycine hydroxymethyltransferase